ncbi:efflux RND transporter periplasmic adaptor subunit [Idiomarina seosinensis]|uniref:Efflux RND transporter periplasmic adaptor subunit n=1 Tax=Idiomarina seosinensis TaxID=281739 RepID=A0A432ZIZ1_9GAMM|nr:efflux RND transporter periplasmic adaptor subunit [Idiomarina seosinensis]RUO77909.1 efflux RND transporter periplasmic adaptor subunit [Idiomarina seosinensis]
MKIKKRAFIPPLIIIVAIALAVVASMSAKPPEQKQQQKPGAMVEVKEVSPRDMTFLVDSQGTAVPKYSTTLLAEVSGQIIEVSDKYNAGGFFKKGEMLLQIDPSDYQVAVQQARAQLLQAQASLEEERARSKVAEEEWSQFTDGEAPALGLRKPQLASALASLESAEANLAMAQRNLERTTIKAPYDSVLRSKQAGLGQFVGAGAQIATLFGTEVAEVRLPLSDLDVTYLNLPEEGSEHPKVLLESQVSGVDTEWLGSLVRTEGVLDENSRVIYGVVEVQDPYNLSADSHEQPLRFGRFVQAQVKGQQVSDVMEVPTYAINPDDTVWVVGDERQLNKKPVEVIRTQQNTSIVGSGLEKGDKVVLTQLKNALTGMKVRLPGDPLPEQMESSEVAEKSNQVAENANSESE